MSTLNVHTRRSPSFTLDVGAVILRRLRRKVALIFLLAVPGAAAAPREFQAAVLADAPALYYQFNESTGPAINHGSWGAAFNASYFGTPTRARSSVSGDSGVLFDGADDYLESHSEAPASMTGNPTFTAEALVFVPTSGFAAMWAPFLHWGPSDSYHNSIMKSVYFGFSNRYTDRLFAGFYHGGLWTASPVPTVQWNHVVWVREGGNPANVGSTLYVNGIAVTLANDPPLPANAGTPVVEATSFRINRARDRTRYFTGILDELALYPRALTAEEVRRHLAAFGTPTLNIRRISRSQVEISWKPAAPGFVLQQSADPQKPVWTSLPSAGATPVIVPMGPTDEFFRLERP